MGVMPADRHGDRLVGRHNTLAPQNRMTALAIFASDDGWLSRRLNASQYWSAPTPHSRNGKDASTDTQRRTRQLGEHESK